MSLLSHFCLLKQVTFRSQIHSSHWLIRPILALSLFIMSNKSAEVTETCTWGPRYHPENLAVSVELASENCSPKDSMGPSSMGRGWSGGESGRRGLMQQLGHLGTEMEIRLGNVRDSLGEMPVKDKGERKQEQAGRAFKLWVRTNIYEMRGEWKENRVGRVSDCSTALRTFLPGKRVPQSMDCPPEESHLGQGRASPSISAMSLTGWEDAAARGSPLTTL